jgi:transposase
LPKAWKARGGRCRHPSGFDLRGQLYRITGVALTQIDGIEVQNAQTIISEVGVDMSRWKTEKHFASWLVCVRTTTSAVARCSARYAASSQSRLYRFTTGGISFAPKPERFGSQVPPTALQTWGTQSHHCHGARARPSGLPNAEVRP